MPLTTAEANALLNASTLQGAYPNTSGPTRLGLVTAQGNASTPGTEVSGGSGPYSRQSATFGTAAVGATIANTSAITFTGMPACTVVGVEIWDAAATPNRKWFGPLTTQRNLQAGDSISFAVSSISLALGTS